MKRSFCMAACVVLYSASLYGQTPANYTVKFFTPPDNTTPMAQTDSFPASAAQCNLDPVTGGSTVNPTTYIWDDTVPNKVCMFVTPTTSVLRSLPAPGSYEAVIVASNAAGSSPDSNKSPFSRLAIPGVRTGFKVARAFFSSVGRLFG